MSRIFPSLPFLIIGLSLSVLMSCSSSSDGPQGLARLLTDAPSLAGKQEYLASPYVTAGDRVYMVGHQDGSFPELGWHITGEMGGIWDHPIKLMDGFEILLVIDEDTLALNKAAAFVNYPMANRHRFSFPEQQLTVDRWQFVPDGKEGLSIQVALTQTGQTIREIQVLFRGYPDLRPTWLGERTNMIDHSDLAEYDQALGAWVARDSANPWFVVFGADQKAISHEAIPTPFAGKGTGAQLGYSLSLPAGSSSLLTFTIAGSYQNQASAQATYKDIQARYLDYAHLKKARYEGLAQQTRLTVPDTAIQTAFEWVKYNCDWLIRTVPEVGTGITAGIPDYPWWFGVDSEYALKGYMAIGQRDAVFQTISLLDSLSQSTNGNGRIVHEVSTNGAVFNPGNINETPQYASLIWEVYRWHGDKAWLKTYFPTVKKGLAWLMETRDTNGNLFPEGFGMMEIHGLDSEMIDVAAYTQRAFADAAQIAAALDEIQLAEKYGRMAQQLADKINQDFWSEEFASYADFIGTDAQALHLIEDAIVRADTLDKPWAIEELEATREAILANPSRTARPFVLYHNWVVNTPLEMGIADTAQALVALETAEKFVNPFGVFVTGIDRDESAGSEDGSFVGSKAFSYTGAVMTLPTGVQIVAENNYGRPNEALNYLHRMTRSFSFALPGSMYEVSPDYGMMTQAWNIYSMAIPVVQQFFGVQPDAANKRVVVQPQMPDAWDEASLEDIMVGTNRLSVFYSQTPTNTRIRLKQTATDWELILPLLGVTQDQVDVQGGEVVMQGGKLRVKGKGNEVEVNITR